MSQFTAEQQQIIQADKGNILVSAAAGSGKTTVMVERITKRIQEGLVDVSKLLVLTFTDAAAKNMKAKINSSLYSALQEATSNEDKIRLNRQVLLLPYAPISTIHSFCLSVVREYAYLLEEPLDQDFRAADQSLSDELFQNALDEVLAKWYARLEAIDDEETELEESGEQKNLSFTLEEQEEARQFLLMLDSYAGSKSDQGIKDEIRAIYSFLRSMPDYKTFVERALEELRLASTDFDQSKASLVLRQRLLRVLVDAKDALDEAYALYSSPDLELKSTKTAAGYAENEALKASGIDTIEEILALRHRLETEDQLGFDEIRTCLASLEFPKVRRHKNYPDRNRVLDIVQYQLSAITGFYQKEKDAPRGIAPVFRQPLADVQDDIRAMLPVIFSLFRLLLDTDDAYKRLKMEQGVIDFNDFEHLALELLRKTEVMEAYSTRISEIYVDEYQDTSSIQNTIIEAIAKQNMFVVGDIKQSIYRFRHARPEIFNHKMKLYSQDTGDGTVYQMSQNFRSVKGVLDAVNEIFSAVMEEQVGEINYQDGHLLRHFHENMEEVSWPVEFVLIDSGQETTASVQDEGGADETLGNTEEPLSAVENQGRIIADIIIKEGYGLSHPVAKKLSDITVLCMTHAHAKSVSQELLKQGLAVSGEVDDGYLETTELRLMEALFRLLGNELQDLPLLTCLRTLPLYGEFSDEELLKMKAFYLAHKPDASPYDYFHTAVYYYEEHGEDLALRARVQAFRAWIHSLREASIYLSLNELINRIFQESALLDHVAADDEASTRIDNLKAFRTWAESFEARGKRGLSYFVTYLEEKRRKGEDRSPFEEADPEDNSIRVITFHKSKGLEFPLVFLVGLERQMISAPRGHSWIDLSESGGIAFQVRRPDQMLAYPSVISMTYQEEKTDLAFAEAMRLLYVAMTRAEKKLYCIASVSRGLHTKDPKKTKYQEKLTHFQAIEQKPFGRMDLAFASTYADLILMTKMYQNEDLYTFFSTGELGTSRGDGPWRHTLLASDAVWPYRYTKVLEDNATKDAVLGNEETVMDETEFMDILKSKTVQYPYLEATLMPQKYAVSELKRRMQRQAMEIDQEDSLGRQEDGQSLGTFATAGINTQIDDWLAVKEKGVKDASPLRADERGTALHTALRFLDLKKLRGQGLDAIGHALGALLDEGVLLETEYEAVIRYREELYKFVESDLARKIVEAEMTNGHVYREVPFTLAENVDDLNIKDLKASGERIMVQGIIDLWFRLDGEIILVDFKSDRLWGSFDTRLKTLEERYKLQLEFYAKAILAATGYVVSARYIWSIPEAKVYEIKA